MFDPLGVDPDDTYNETPYEKGYCFVSYLAHLVGDQSKFDAFLQVRGVGSLASDWGALCAEVLEAGKFTPSSMFAGKVSSLPVGTYVTASQVLGTF